jgi:hypothetical protein
MSTGYGSGVGGGDKREGPIGRRARIASTFRFQDCDLWIFLFDTKSENYIVVFCALQQVDCACRLHGHGGLWNDVSEKQDGETHQRFSLRLQSRRRAAFSFPEPS